MRHAVAMDYQSDPLRMQFLTHDARNPVGSLKNLCREIDWEVGEMVNMVLGDHERLAGTNRLMVHEGQDLVVLKNPACFQFPCDDPAKNAISFHFLTITKREASVRRRLPG